MTVIRQENWHTSKGEVLGRRRDINTSEIRAIDSLRLWLRLELETGDWQLVFIFKPRALSRADRWRWSVLVLLFITNELPACPAAGELLSCRVQK